MKQPLTAQQLVVIILAFATVGFVLMAMNATFKANGEREAMARESRAAYARSVDRTQRALMDLPPPN